MMMDIAWILLLVVFAAAFLIRATGVVISGHVEPETPLFDWFACVGQALVGGLMVRAILLPTTPLAETLLADRLIAIAAAFLMFFLAGRKLLPSTFVGVATLAILGMLRSL